MKKSEDVKRRESRRRNVPALQEREKVRPARLPRPNENKPKLEVLPFNPNAPQIFVSKKTNTVYTKYTESLKNFPWVRLAITFLIVLVGGVGSAWLQAHNARIQRAITQSEIELREYQSLNIALESLLQEHYTFYEIERIAIDRLGMSFPDPAQIINIYVPRVGGVTLNTADYAMPQHNYFWNDVGNFLSGILNRIFGG